ncbi:hypothetical protein DNTS_028331, partial [Danionella cerebrum]
EKTPSPRLIRKVYSNNKLRASGLLLVLDFNHGGMLLLRQRRTSVLGVCEAILFREKPYPAEPSCVSLKSHQSMYRPIEFNDRPLADDLRVNFISSESSCGSLKSEPSLNRRMGFKERKSVKYISSKSSCGSLKKYTGECFFREEHLFYEFVKLYSSDVPCITEGIMEDTISAGNKDISSLKREKTNPVEPSCVSLKSDRSMDRPIEFND